MGVVGEDSSVNILQQYAAKLTGKEAALFTPSGTMVNIYSKLTLKYFWTIVFEAGFSGDLLVANLFYHMLRIYF